MKNPYEVLQQKEADPTRVRHEIECLQIIASLLSDEPSLQEVNSPTESSTETSLEHDTESKATGTEGLFSSLDSRPKFWGVLKRGR